MQESVRDNARKVQHQLKNCLSRRLATLTQRVPQNKSRNSPPKRAKLEGELSKIVCISDTHGMHRNLIVPDGDILIHAGDFTRYGNLSEAKDFNVWIGELPHKIKIVILGNHESNANWSNSASEIISNAEFLRNTSLILERDEETGLPPIHIYGTDFYWPSTCRNHAYDLIPPDTNILLSHGPPSCHVDGNNGCKFLRSTIDEKLPKCNLLVCGHIHFAHGLSVEKKVGMDQSSFDTTYINASCAGHHRELKYPPIILNCASDNSGITTFTTSASTEKITEGDRSKPLALKKVNN